MAGDMINDVICAKQGWQAPGGGSHATHCHETITTFC